MKGYNFNHWFLQYLINVVKLRKIQVVGGTEHGWSQGLISSSTLNFTALDFY